MGTKNTTTLANFSWIDTVQKTAWFVLSVLMLVSIFLLQSQEHEWRAWLVVLLLLATVTYPRVMAEYDLAARLVAHIVYLLFVFIAAIVVWNAVLLSAVLLIPSIVWAFMNTVYAAAQLRK